MLTKEQQQHILNCAYAHCKEQKVRARRSFTDGGTYCAYLTPDGLKCAIGAGLSGEDLGRFAAEPAGVFSLLEEGLERVFGVPVRPEDVGFLSAIQGAHDSKAHLENQIDLARFDALAQFCGLIPPSSIFGEPDEAK